MSNFMLCWIVRGSCILDHGSRVTASVGPHRKQTCNMHACCELIWLCRSAGRKHQLRLHCASALHSPILGDDRYGVRKALDQTSLDGSKLAGRCHVTRWLVLHHAPGSNHAIIC